MFDNVILCNDGLSILPKIKSRDHRFNILVRLIYTKDEPSVIAKMTYDKLLHLPTPDEFLGSPLDFIESSKLQVEQSPSYELSLIAKGHKVNQTVAKGHTIYVFAKDEKGVYRCLLGASEDQDILSDDTLYLTILIEETNGQFIPTVDYDGYIPTSLALSKLEAAGSDYHEFPSNEVDVKETYSEDETEVIELSKDDLYNDNYTTGTAGVIYPKKTTVTISDTPTLKSCEEYGWIRTHVQLQSTELFEQNGKSYGVVNTKFLQPNDLKNFNAYTRIDKHVFIKPETFFRYGGINYLNLNSNVTFGNRTARFRTPVTESNQSTADLTLLVTKNGSSYEEPLYAFVHDLVHEWSISYNLRSAVRDWVTEQLGLEAWKADISTQYSSRCEAVTGIENPDLEDGTVFVVQLLENTEDAIAFLSNNHEPFDEERFDISLKNNFMLSDNSTLMTGEVKLGTEYDSNILVITDENTSNTKVISNAEVTELNNRASIKDTLYLDGDHTDIRKIEVRSGEGAAIGTRSKHLQSIHSNIVQCGQSYAKTIYVGTQIRPNNTNSPTLGTPEFYWNQSFLGTIYVYDCSSSNTNTYLSRGVLTYDKDGFYFTNNLLPTELNDDSVKVTGAYYTATLGSQSHVWNNVYTSKVTLKSKVSANNGLGSPLVYYPEGTLSVNIRQNDAITTCIESSNNVCPSADNNLTLGSKNTYWKSLYSHEVILGHYLSVRGDYEFTGKLTMEGELEDYTIKASIPFESKKVTCTSLNADSVHIWYDDEEETRGYHALSSDNSTIYSSAHFCPVTSYKCLGSLTIPWSCIYTTGIVLINGNNKANLSYSVYNDGIDVTGNVTPTANNTYSLGASAYAWKNLYVTTTNTESIKIGTISSNVTLNYNLNSLQVDNSIIPDTTSKHSLGISSKAWNNIYTYAINFVQGSNTTKLNYYNEGIDVTGNLSPVSNNKYSLGTSSYKWLNLNAVSLSGSASAIAQVLAPESTSVGEVGLFYLSKTVSANTSSSSATIKYTTVAGSDLRIAKLYINTNGTLSYTVGSSTTGSWRILNDAYFMANTTSTAANRYSLVVAVRLS